MNTVPRIHRYVIYCDEAYTSQPKFRFHHYYGGVFIEEAQAAVLDRILAGVVDQHSWNHELKWQKVTGMALPVYLDFVNAFFDELAKGRCRFRAMFLDKRWKPTNLGPEQKKLGYHILYYLFISRAFGLDRVPLGPDECLMLRLFFDKLPDRRENNERFKEFIRNMPRTPRFRGTPVVIPEDGVSEIDSKVHLIAQAVDVVIGALGFRLNKLHEVTGPDGRRGKRTRAKGKLSELIRDRLRPLGVKNIGISTGRRSGERSAWFDAARLWKFIPSDFELDDRWGADWARK